jgi:DNA-3-methyladenine glycosylase II
MGSVSFEMEVRPPFRLDLTVWALRRRPHNTIDTWDGTTYTRTLVVDAMPVLVAVHQRPATRGRARLAVTVHDGRSEPNDTAVAQVRRILGTMLGLGTDPTGFSEMAARDARLAALAHRFRGMRPPRFPSPFEALVNAVACQQLSLTVGIHLLDRLAAAHGPGAGLPGAAPGFPTADGLAAVEPAQLRRLGFSEAKARTIVGLARRVVSGTLDLDGLQQVDDEHAAAALMALPGIGRWSAEYVLLRGLGRLGVLPGDDVGARNNLRRHFDLPVTAGYDEVAALTRRWWPHGGLVYFHLLLDALDRAGHLRAAGADRTDPQEVA